VDFNYEMQLRREKIAERMKNLQELVPNSNKVLNSVHHLFLNLTISSSCFFFLKTFSSTPSNIYYFIRIYGSIVIILVLLFWYICSGNVSVCVPRDAYAHCHCWSLYSINTSYMCCL